MPENRTLRRLRALLGADVVQVWAHRTDGSCRYRAGDPPMLPGRRGDEVPHCTSDEMQQLAPRRHAEFRDLAALPSSLRRLVDAHATAPRSPESSAVGAEEASATARSPVVLAIADEADRALLVVWRDPTAVPTHVRARVRQADPCFTESVCDQLSLAAHELEAAAAVPRLAAVLENVPGALVLIDEEHGTAIANHAAEALLGRLPRSAGGEVEASVVREAIRALRERLRNADRVADEGAQLFRDPDAVRRDWQWECLPPDGRTLLVTTLPVRGSAHRGRLWWFQDVSERVNATLHLRASQRLESVGRLTGGIAHDFNNLLMVIGGNAELLLETLPPGTQPHADAREVQQAATRAAELTRRLLRFSRHQHHAAPHIVLDEAVEGAARLLRRVIGETITLVVECHAEDAHIAMDAVELEQALLNLAINARDAMPHGGTLTLRTARSDVPPPTPWPGAAPARHVRVSVGDTGVGMDAATVARAREPLFTTKAEDQGTGLGLSTVSDVVAAQGGVVWIDSAPGVGTTVTLALPEVSADDVAAPIAFTHEQGARHGTILIVEDERAVQQLLVRLLRDAGYAVHVAADGAAALRAWQAVRRQTGAPPDLVITDVVMPELGGRELHDTLRALDPGARVLFMSGYLDRAPGDSELDRRSGFLAKPFSRDALLLAIHRLMTAP